MPTTRTAYRTCTLCEATCGLAIEIEDEKVVTVRGDKDDPFSKGYICPKAYGMKGLYEDPDRLRRPVRKTADGGWEEISWEDAYAETARRLLAIREEHGPDALAWYRGNPTVHDVGAVFYWPLFQRAMGKNYYSAATLDTMPKYVQAGLMFGGMLHLAIPDLDRTDYLLALGANPMASNGSLMTAPNAPARLKGIIERGGKVVLVDPRRSETADIASEHLFVRPGTDICFLLAVRHVMFAEDLVTLGRCEGIVDNLDTVREVVSAYAPEAVASHCGIPAETIRRVTREFCAAEAASCYGRVGTCTQAFGTLASWAVDLVNILSGNLDRPGGAMFTTPAANVAGAVGPAEFDRYRSRVSGFGEVYGQFPAAALPEEIETPGEGQIRALVLLASNPVCTAPNAERLDRALASLDFVVAIDIYINDTTRRADLILPPTSALEHGHYDAALYNVSIRDVAKWSDAVFEPEPGAQHTWEILLTLGKHLMGMGEMDNGMVDAFVLRQYADMAVGAAAKRWEGLTTDEAVAKLGDRPGPERILDLLLRTGMYGDGFGREADGLTLEKLKTYEHGLDLGALKAQLPDRLTTPNGKIDLAPERIVADLKRLEASLERNGDEAGDLLLIGRRHLRSANTVLANVQPLVKGPRRCTLQVSEVDAQRLQLETDGLARVTSRVGSIVAPVEVTHRMMPGVVSMPWGWGHDRDGTRMRVAQAYPGVNSNILTHDEAFDVPSWTSVLNGIPVTVEPLS